MYWELAQLGVGTRAAGLALAGNLSNSSIGHCFPERELTG